MYRPEATLLLTIHVYCTLPRILLQELCNLHQVFCRQLHVSASQIFQCSLCVPTTPTWSSWSEEYDNKRGTCVKKKTHEDLESGIMWSLRAPTHTMHSCATVMPFRFAMTDKPSTNWRLCPIFWGRVGMSVGWSEAGARKMTLYIILETTEPAPEIAFFEVLTALDLTGE